MIMDDTLGIREAIIDTCLQCVRTGYFFGTWGNVSARCGDKLLITPTRVHYANLTLADLVLVDVGKPHEPALRLARQGEDADGQQCDQQAPIPVKHV